MFIPLELVLKGNCHDITNVTRIIVLGQHYVSTARSNMKRATEQGDNTVS